MNSAICTKIKNDDILEKKMFMNHHDLAQKIFDNLKSPLNDNVISFLDEHKNIKQELEQKNCLKNQPKKVWEIHPHFQCPIMGICLTFEENKKVLKKIVQTKGLDHYSLHRIIMGYIDKENPISIKIERFLNKKYKKQLSYLLYLDEDAFLSKWQEMFGNEPIDAMLYIASIRSDLSPSTVEKIYGDIHMGGHTSMENLLTLRDRCGFLEDSNKRMLRLLKQERKGRSFLEDQIASLKQCIKSKDKIQKKEESVPLKNSSETDLYEKVKYENQVLLAQINKVQNENKEQAKYIKKIEQENRQLQADFFDLQSNHQLLMDEINSLIAQLSFFMKFNDNCDEKCPKYHICAKRVLIVGGITKMKHLYKDLVECSGGEFEYHDGYVKNGTQNLENQVKRADLILCPVNCNSHTACKKVKGLCNKFDKPLKILTNASLSTISNALVSDSESINSL